MASKSWNEIVSEVNALNRPDAYDIVRRQKLDTVRQITGRHLVVYAADFTNPLKLQFAGNFMSISLSDKDGFDEVTRNLPRGSNLDVLLHSPGGSAEATESIVDLLRARFSHIRFIIPSVAKSAATIMAMSGDELLMDEQSELGPTDPQMLLNRDGQQIMAPAQAIKDQFEVAQREVNNDPSKLPAWVPILREYGPALLVQCDNHLQLADTLVAAWLEKYMFKGETEAGIKARQISQYLAGHNNFLSHARRIGINELVQRDVKVVDMRTTPELDNAVHDLYTAINVTFMNTTAVKIFENDQHEALIQSVQAQVQVMAPPNFQPQQPAPSQQPPRPQPTRLVSPPPISNRAQRRAGRKHK